MRKPQSAGTSGSLLMQLSTTNCKPRSPPVLYMYIKIILFLSENSHIPEELQEDALAVQKTLDWDDKGADGKHFTSQRLCNIHVM